MTSADFPPDPDEESKYSDEELREAVVGYFFNLGVFIVISLAVVGILRATRGI